MKYLKELFIILLISFVSEMLNFCIFSQIPASIYGIVILFLLLQFKLISIDSLKSVSSLLIDVMPIMFIPSAVGLIEIWDIIRPNFIIYLLITIIPTLLVMIISGKTTQVFVNSERKGRIDE